MDETLVYSKSLWNQESIWSTIAYLPKKDRVRSYDENWWKFGSFIWKRGFETKAKKKKSWWITKKIHWGTRIWKNLNYNIDTWQLKLNCTFISALPLHSTEMFSLSFFGWNTWTWYMNRKIMATCIELSEWFYFRKMKNLWSWLTVCEKKMSLRMSFILFYNWRICTILCFTLYSFY